MLRKIYLKVRPFHFFLLTPFFLLHINNYYYGLLPQQVIIKSTISFLALTTSLFFFLKVFLKTNDKIGAFAFVTLGYFFGFGAIKDFLETIPFVYKITPYRYLLSIIIVMLALLFIYIKKTSKDLTRLNNFLFIVVTANLLLEILFLAKNIITNADIKNDLGDSELTEVKKFNPCTNCQSPDIFYIIFDEYTSSDCLQKYWHFSNDTINTYFQKNNFYVSEKSKSNYCFTTFSLASTLEMQYLNVPDNYTNASAHDLGRGEYTIMKNTAIKLLEKQGYRIHNYSIFDFENYPTNLGTYFYQLRDRFVDDETLFGRIKRDILWRLSKLQPKEKIIKEFDDKKIQYATNIHYAFNLAKSVIKKQANNNQKDFFYFHFVIPHDPFAFDAKGNIKKYNNSIDDIRTAYLDQLKYTNTLLMDIVNYIQSQYNRKAVIILQGDHGFKEWPGEENYTDIAFQNLNAIFLPDTNYTRYYNGVSPVNTFRLLFNHYFNTKFDILPDKSIQIFINPELKKNYGLRQKNK